MAKNEKGEQQRKPSRQRTPSARVSSTFGRFFVLGALALVFGSGWFGSASAASGERGVVRQFAPTACSGWGNASAAKKLDAAPNDSIRDFADEDAAVFSYAPSDFAGGLAGSPSDLTCERFDGRRFKESEKFTDGAILVSLASYVDEHAETPLIIELSTDDGLTWRTTGTLVLAGEQSNATNGGYFRYPLPYGIVKSDFERLAVRVRVVSDESYGNVGVLVDGIAIEGTIQKTEASRRPFFSLLETPTIIVDDASLDGYELLDAEGRPVAATPVIEVVDGKTKLSFSTGSLVKPGTYVLRTKSKKLFRTAIEERRFTFGVATMNTSRAGYEPGDVVPIAVGVLDERGKTVCDATMSLRVIRPDGSSALLSTSDGSVAGSAECGPESITSQPDYSATFVADVQGTYRLSLEIATNAGVERLTKSFDVLPALASAFTIERRAPTRINPKADYVTQLSIVANRAYAGAVEETLPAGFGVHTVSHGGRIEERDGKPVVIWDVDWRQEQRTNLSYAFDAPDISPALYTVEPLRLGAYTEPREWTIASDELVRREKQDLAYEQIPLDEADRAVAQEEPASATKPQFDADEEAQVKVYKEGYVFPKEAVPDNLDPKARVTVEKVDIVAPDGNADTTLHVSEEFRDGAKDVEFLHLIPQRKFTPGEWTIKTTVTDGKESAVVSETFVWGVLVLNTRKTVYQPGELVEFAMGGVDSEGNTVCRAPMNLVIMPPDGSSPTILSSDAGTIHFSEECSATSVTNAPDYSASFTPTVAGEYKLTLAALTDENPYTIQETLVVREEAAPFEITRKSIPSRVYPLGEYDITLTVKPITDFKGTFEELLPVTYGIIDIGQDGEEREKDEQTRAILWEVEWQAGVEHELTYRMDPEDVSPALFLIGPASVGGFQELRPWRIASDIISTAAVDASTANQADYTLGDGRKMVFTSDTVGYIFYNNSTVSTSYGKTTNAGMTWTVDTAMTAQTDTENFSIWYDQWTPGDTGTKVHIAFVENGTDDVYYDYLDTNGDSQGTEVLAYSDASTARTAPTDSVSITKATDGDLYIVDSTSGASSVAAVRYSTNAGANWNDAADEGLDNATGDHVMLLPQPAGDILLLRWDVSADDIQSKEYEDGGNSWAGAWTDIDTNAIDSGTYSEAWSASLNPATWEVYLAYIDQAGTTGSSVTDVRTAYYNTTSWTAGTDVMTNYDTIISVTTGLDTITGEIYVSCAHGVAAGTTVQVYYKVSTDTMSTWSNQRGPIVNLSTTINGLVGNFASPYRLSVWAWDSALADIWFGDMADVGGHANALQVGNIEGFETQSALTSAVANVGTTSYSTGTFRSGAAALRTNPSSATGYTTMTFGYGANGKDPLTNYNGFSSVFAMRIASGTTINQQSIIYSATDGSTVVAELSVNANQTLSLTTGTDVNGSFALVDDTWYVVAFAYNINIDVLLVGIYSSDMVTQHEELQQTVTSATTTDRVRIGPQTASTTADIYFDDFMVYPHATVVQFPLLRDDYRVEPMVLNATGTDTAWTNTYTNLTELPTVVSDASYIESQGAAAAETSNLESASSAGISGSVLAVRLTNMIWESSAATTSIQGIRWREGASLENSTAVDASGTAAAPINYSSILVDEVATTSLWDTTSLDALEVGVLTATSETVFYRNGSSVVQVAFVPASTITVSGTCRNFADSADCTDPGGAEAIKIVIDGVVQAQTDAVVDASWSIASVAQPSRGQVVTVFIDGVGDTDEAVAVTRYDGEGDITGVSLYKETLSLGSVDDQTIHNYDIARYDNSFSADEDVFPDVDVNAGNNLTVDSTSQSSTEKLTTLSGDIYKPYGNVITHDFTMNGNVLLTGITSPAWTVSGSWNKAAGTFSGGTSTITFTGTSENIDGAAATAFNNLTIDPASAGTITINTSNPQVNGLFTVASGDALSIASSLTLQLNAAATTSIDGTVSGAGTLAVLNSNLDADSGTLTSIVRFVAQSSPITAPARTYGGLVEMVNTAIADREIQLGAGAHTYQNNLHVLQSGGNAITVNGAQNDPTMAITGNLDFTSTLGTITTGDNNWTVSGNVDLTSGTYTTAGTHTLIMNGTSKTLTSASQTLLNVTLSGSITLANETHTIAGDFSMAGGTITAGSSTVTMTGTKNLVGGSQTLNNLTVDGTNTTVSLITSDLSVSGTLTIGGAADSNNDTLTIGTGRVLTSGTAGTVTFVASGTDLIDGAGRLDVQNSNLDSDGTLSVDTRLDATAGSINMPARTYGGDVELYNNATDAIKNITPQSGTVAITGTLTMNTANTRSLRYLGTSFNPDLTVTGDIDFTGVGSSNEQLLIGSGTLTASGNMDFRDGTVSTTGTIIMNGVSKALWTPNGTIFQNFTVDPTSTSTITLNDGGGADDLEVSGTLTIGAGETLSLASGALMYQDGAITWGDASSTIAGAGIVDFWAGVPGPGTGGVISAITRYDASFGNVANTTVDARTYNGPVQFYSNVATAQSITFATGTYTLSGASSHFSVIADGASPGDLTLDAASNDPTVTIGGDLDFTGTGSATEIVTAGAGTWTVSGSANLTDGTWTTEGTNKLVMDGTGTLTTDNETLLNLDINSSGTVTLAAATHTVSGNLLLGGSGTPTVTGSTISISGSGKTIDGGGKTLNNLTLDGGGTTTLQNTDLTVSGTLNVTTNDTLSINASRTLTHSGGTFTFPDTATISGAGTFTFTDASPGPGTTGTLSSVVRFDATGGTVATTTVDARTYGGAVEFYSNVAAVRAINFAAGTYTFSSTFSVITGASQSSVLTVDATNGGAVNPTVNITGALAYTKDGSATPALTTGSGTWTLSGNITLTNGTLNASTNNTVILNGAAKQTVTSASQSFYNLTLTNASGSFTGCGSPMTTPGLDFADATSVTNNFTITTQNVKVEFEPSVNHVFQNINWNGVATDGIVFRSESAAAWNLDINGTQTDVSYVSVAYSNATLTAGGVLATNGTNTDCNNNTNWNFGTVTPDITFSISDTSIGFGTITDAAARWATGDTNGSASDSAAAHTLQITTNGDGGYQITYSGALLTRSGGAQTIDAAAITNDENGTSGSEQFGIGASTDGASTIATGYDHNATAAQRDWTFVAGSPQVLVSKTSAVASTETISVFYLGNVASTTESGAYATDVTFIATSTF